ncbi:uncharacterized protein LOC144135439 isoform X1 [Amblyomma americanum]
MGSCRYLYGASYRVPGAGHLVRAPPPEHPAMKPVPSTRAATLCCACVLALGPAAQALLFQKAAPGQKPNTGGNYLDSPRAPPRHSPQFLGAAVYTLSQPSGGLGDDVIPSLEYSPKKTSKPFALAPGAASTVYADAAAVLSKLDLPSRTTLLTAFSAGLLGALPCPESLALPDDVPSTARKKPRALFSRPRDKGRRGSRRHRRRVGPDKVPALRRRSVCASFVTVDPHRPSAAGTVPTVVDPDSLGLLLGACGFAAAASARSGDSVALKLVQAVLDKSHRVLLDVAGKMPNLVPRMDAQECLKRTVCEAHNKPGRYGLIGIALQFFFPPFRPGDADGTRMSPLQLAARYGRDPSADCGRQYDGCFLDLLQTMQGAVDYFLRRQQKQQLASAGTRPLTLMGLLSSIGGQQQSRPPVVWDSSGYGVVEPITAPPP